MAFDPHLTRHSFTCSVTNRYYPYIRKRLFNIIEQSRFMRSSATTGQNKGHSKGNPYLPGRFKELWVRSLIPGAPMNQDAVWESIDSRYHEAHRHYHVTGHLAYCLAELDLVRDLVGQPDCVEMAVWFHDVVLDPGQPDNEASSAAFFRGCANDAMDEGFIANAVDLILATTHKDFPTEGDRRFVCDIDLSSLACPWDCYLRDTNNLRAEFPGSNDEFKRRQQGFLGSLLSRSSIFATEVFIDRYESRARSNIRRFLDSIAQS